MWTRGGVVGVLGLGLGLLVIGPGCKSDEPTASKDAGCTKDTDCKGDRVCQDGKCTADGAATSTTAKAGKPKPGGDFAKVQEGGWVKRLGPKMKAGSKMAHSVFEGPFGPSPKSLFAVTQRSDESLWVLVMGDDGKSWPAGPLHDVDQKGGKVEAVSFFDANGDGTTDALVVASYADGHGRYNKNVLLKWTDRGMRRLLKLEPKIEAFKSVAEVKRTLGR
jgi:hypothetical protein